MHPVRPRILKPDEKQRSGRGFSTEELKKAGLNFAEARRMGLPADLRRRTMHNENVEVLKAYAEKKRAEVKPKPKPAPKQSAKPAAKSKKEKSKS
jgi:ribosomal protein L13E